MKGLGSVTPVWPCLARGGVKLGPVDTCLYRWQPQVRHESKPKHPGGVYPMSLMTSASVQDHAHPCIPAPRPPDMIVQQNHAALFFSLQSVVIITAWLSQQLY